MRDILEGIVNDEDGKPKKSGAWCSFFFYLFMLLSFVMSIAASYKATKGYINKTLFTYKFPAYESQQISAGAPVSLSYRGYAQRGAGFGIYRNVSVTTGDEMTRLKLEVIGNGTIAVAAYDGYLKMYYLADKEAVLSNEKWTLRLDKRHNIRTIDHLIKLTETQLIVVASNLMLPVTITDKMEGKKHSFEVIEGIDTILDDGEQTIFPHMDNLDYRTVCLSYEKNYQLMAMTARLEGEGKDAHMIMGTPAVANADGVFGFHGVAGMSKSKFLIAATGIKVNATGEEKWKTSPIRVKVVKVSPSGELTFGNWVERWFTNNTNWFALDNFNNRTALITYYDETMNNGVVALSMFLDNSEDGVHFGGYTMVESGGAAIGYQRISMRILSDVRFGVFFPDMSNNGNLIFMMGEMTANRDLIRVGSNFVVSRKSSKTGSFWFAIAQINYSHFVLLDSFKGDNDQRYSSLNIGYHMSYPIGITTDRSKKTKYIQFNGVYKFTNKRVKLIPGTTYYTNSQGDIIAGKMYGFNNAESGNFYVESEDRLQVLALHNQIGVAVSEKELLIRTY